MEPTAHEAFATRSTDELSGLIGDAQQLREAGIHQLSPKP
jgi:hypothetical protein